MVASVDSSADLSYRIVVKGRFSERLASGFDGLELERRPGLTVLSGADSGELDGVLARLRALNIELVSVDAVR